MSRVQHDSGISLVLRLVGRPTTTVMLHVYKCLLPVFGYRRIILFSQKMLPRPVRADPDLARRILNSARAFGRFQPSNCTCLHKAMATWITLRACRIDSHIVTGVRRQGKVLELHAWVQIGAYVVENAEYGPKMFKPLPDIESGKWRDS